jgi:hypothetical protein
MPVQNWKAAPQRFAMLPGDRLNRRVPVQSPSSGGCRRLTFMMLDADIVAVSPSSVWCVLSQAGRFAIRPCTRPKRAVSHSKRLRDCHFKGVLDPR